MQHINEQELTAARVSNAVDYAWLDVLRVLAAIAVIVQHVSGEYLVVSKLDSTDYWASFLINCSVRWAVPVFVMISGALLIAPSRPQTVVQFYSRRAHRILVPLLFWSGLYLGISYFFHTEDSGHQVFWQTLVWRFVTGTPSGHLWYLFMLVGLYAFTPFVNIAMRAMTLRDKYIILGLLLSLTFLYGATGQTATVDPFCFLFWFLPYLGYFVCGAMIKQSQAKVCFHSSYLSVLFCLTVLLTALGVRWFGPSASIAYSPTVIPMSIAVFLLIAGIKDKIRSSWLLKHLAMASFGVYLVHLLVVKIFVRGGLLHNNIYAALSIPIFSVLVLLVSLAVVFVFKKLPLLKHTI